MICIFKVQLRCEAAPEIGCGVRAKPVLQVLERCAGIREAWLNQAGSLIRIVGTEKGCEAAGPLLRRHRVRAERLHGERLRAALDALGSESGWRSSTTVDRLSEEEARTIARRLAGRLRAKTELTAARARTLERAIEAACSHELIHNPTQSASARKRRLASAALAAVRGRVSDAQYAAFADVVRMGHRPRPDER